MTTSSESDSGGGCGVMPTSSVHSRPPPKSRSAHPGRIRVDRPTRAGRDRAGRPGSRVAKMVQPAPNSRARRKTASSMSSVSRPVKVFCWLTW